MTVGGPQLATVGRAAIGDRYVGTIEGAGSAIVSAVVEVPTSVHRGRSSPTLDELLSVTHVGPVKQIPVGRFPRRKFPARNRRGPHLGHVVAMGMATPMLAPSKVKVAGPLPTEKEPV